MWSRLALIAGLALALVACGGTTSSGGPTGSVGPTSSPTPTPLPTPKRGTLTGTFTLVDKDIDRVGSSCSGSGGYSDFAPGMNVVVKDEGGKIIGTSSTTPGPVPDEYASVTCVLEFTVEDLPDAKFYSVEIGRRGDLTYSREELDDMGWNLSLSLGT